MTEPNFEFVSLPDCLMTDITEHIQTLQTELPHGNPMRLLEPFDHLTRIRGNFALDLISSIAWAARTVCHAAARAGRTLNSVELRSLGHALDSMDRAR